MGLRRKIDWPLPVSSAFQTWVPDLEGDPLIVVSGVLRNSMDLAANATVKLASCLEGLVLSF